MKALEEKIIKEGKVFDGGVLKVDGFLNHKMDVEFLREVGNEFYRIFKEENITKILTVEASGIGIACITALCFEPVVPVVFAKKSMSSNIANEVYSSTVVSFTRGKKYDIIVSKEHLSADDRILIIDDFLAKGSALTSLLDVCHQAGAHVCGAGIVIEKVYQGGGELVKRTGLRVESLAKILEMDTEKGIEGIVFE